VLFGTNYPMITPEKALSGLETLQLDDEARELFPNSNARRVVKLPKQ
jgi:predicted TIM-barrel fold metal-dependent hydrolase